MALIKCPECGKEISDKAPSCIHCGFPLTSISTQSQDNTHQKGKSVKESICPSNIMYSMELLDYGNKKVQVATVLKNALRLKDTEALELMANVPCYVFKDKTEHIAATIIQKLDLLPVEYNLYLNGTLKRHKDKYETDDKPQVIRENKNIRCPKCASLIPETSRSCPSCGFDGIGSHLLQLEREKQRKTIDYGTERIQNVPKCPTCQSTNIKRVSVVSKASSVFMWGLLSQKVKKQWHCNNCGYEW